MNIISDYIYSWAKIFRIGNTKQLCINGFKNIPVGTTITIATVPSEFGSEFRENTASDFVSVSGDYFRVVVEPGGSINLHRYNEVSNLNNTNITMCYI